MTTPRKPESPSRAKANRRLRARVAALTRQMVPRWWAVVKMESRVVAGRRLAWPVELLSMSQRLDQAERYAEAMRRQGATVRILHGGPLDAVEGIHAGRTL